MSDSAAGSGATGSDRLTVVSADGHASMPANLWSEYLDPAYHEFLPRLRAETLQFTRAMTLLNDQMLSAPAREIFDTEGAYADGGFSGLWDLDVRLREMDREGVAAEIVYFGDFRTADMFHNVMNGVYPPEVCDAGARAYDRWAADTLGQAQGRVLVSGAMGSCTDVDGLVAELDWVADHGFVGTYAPGFNGVPGLPPLYDAYWDPVWAAYANRSIVPIVHGGYGMRQGYAFEAIDRADREVRAKGGSETDILVALSATFNEDFFTDLHCRQALSQLLLGGVFDRHPGLRVMFTEIRADWLPATLQYLDSVFEKGKGNLPAKQRPSEYWQSNCLAGLSFMHRAEVEIRHDIGVDTIDFGRDYPHTESTWPNTREYYKVLFSDVPEEDVRKILGENAIRFFNLDSASLARVASRIGPLMADIVGPDDNVDPALVAHLDQRCGLLKPVEGGKRIPALEELLRSDLARLGG